MIQDVNFRFLTNVSQDYYERKTDATACLSREGAKAIGKQKMAFKEQNVSVTEFLGYATTGHSFCNLFEFDPNTKYWIKKGDKWQNSYPVYHNGTNKGCMKLSFKSDEYFKGSQTIFVDVDYTRFKSIDEYVAPLSMKPTCGYYSYSDGKDKGGIISRRFRLVYIFKEVLGKDDMRRISCAIHNHIVLCTSEPMEDNCGTRISQYMNGVYGNPETYQSDIIYSINDFEDYEAVSYGAAEDEANESKTVEFDSQFLYDMGTMSYQDFTHRYSWKYRYYYRTERDEWTDDLYQRTDENYLQLWYYRERQTDGQHRRRKLFKNACLRRLIYPEIDPDTLLYNLYIDLWRFFDNSDHVITLDVVKRKVINAFKMNREELLAYCSYEVDYWQKNRPKFIISHKAKVDMAVINRVRKKVRYNDILQAYDPTLSVKENIANGIDVPERTLYRFCSEYGIDPSPGWGAVAENRRNNRLKRQQKIDLFLQLYDETLSLRENQKELTNHGLKLSLDTIHSWKKRYYEQKPEPVLVWDYSYLQQPQVTTTEYSWFPDVSEWDAAELEKPTTNPFAPENMNISSFFVA